MTISKVSIIIAMLLCMPIGHAIAQEVCGTVCDEDGKPIEAALVMIKNSTGAIIQYAYTSAEGTFKLTYDNSETDEIFIETSMMGYGKSKIPPPFPKYLTIRLALKPYQLDEVKVTAEKLKIHGDTLSYSVPTLISNGDKVLEDILVKLPGIKVDAKGYVRYHGKPVNGVYIEDNDMLEGRYNIATKNLDPKDISKVQIYERHQPIKALEGIVRSDRATINISLKPGAKGKWTATLQAEAGAASEKPWIPYSGSLFLMNISRKFQTVNTLKTDAAGNDIIRNKEASNSNSTETDASNVDFSDRYTETDYLNMVLPMPPIDPKRAMSNISYSASTDNTVVLGKDCTLGVSGEYENNTLDSKDYAHFTYFNGDGSRLEYFNEHNNRNMNAWLGAAGVKLKINSKKLFVKDNLRFCMSGKRTSNNLSGTSFRNEDAKNQNTEIINHLNVIWTASGKSPFSISMLSQYSEDGESLNVMFPEKTDTAWQTIRTKFFYNTLSFGYRVRLGKHFTLTSSTKVDLLYRTFKTELAGNGIEDASDEGLPIRTANDIDMFYIKPQEYLGLTFRFYDFEASVSADTWYQYISGEHHYAINPSLRLKYSFGPRFDISASVSYRHSDIDEQAIYGGVIMQNYKYLSLGRESMTGTPSVLASGRASFSDPFSGWHLHGHVTYLKGSSFESIRYFTGNYIILKNSDKTRPFENITVSAETEKAFLDIVGKLSFGGSFSSYNASIKQNEISTEYTGYTANANVGFSGEFTKWVKLSYKAHYLYNIFLAGNAHTDNATHSFVHSLKLTFAPCKKVDINLSGEHYMNKFQTASIKHTTFIDASLYYYVTDRLQLFLHAKNLLNQKTYTYSNVTPLNSSVFSYRIRPMNILIGFNMKF